MGHIKLVPQMFVLFRMILLLKKWKYWLLDNEVAVKTILVANELHLSIIKKILYYTNIASANSN
jgi:hypothetical protein